MVIACCIKARQDIFLPWEHKQRKPEEKTTKTKDKKWIRVYQAVSLSPMDVWSTRLWEEDSINLRF